MSAEPPAFTADILDFWFGLAPEQHWQPDAALDATIRERFQARWGKQQHLPAGAFLADADSALAAVILFDQFPRNMFRDDARSFATDSLARAIADGAIGRGFDTPLPKERRVFLYLPFEHSEAIADQDRSIALFTAIGDDFYLDFARKHRDVIARFGRFPHRNAALGRESTPEERDFGLEPAW